MVWTCWTGVLVTLADTIWNVRVAPPALAGSWMVNMCVSFALAGNKPALRVAAEPAPTSAPSTLSTVAPRKMFAFAVVAGVFGSVNATRTRRGGLGWITSHSTPYPAETPLWESWSHWAVGMVKWNRSFGLPEGLSRGVFSTAK